jgi:Uma2 family endonuclease
MGHVVVRPGRNAAMVTTKPLTADDLLTMSGDYELIRGELREVSPASAEPTIVTINISSSLFPHVRRHRLGFVTSADGGFVIFSDRKTVVAPDVGFIRRERIPANFDFQHYFPVPPDFAIEVVSPWNTYAEAMEKVALYMEAGVPLVWLVMPRRRVVTVHRPGQEPVTMVEGDELDGGDVVAGFRLSVREVFASPLDE